MTVETLHCTKPQHLLLCVRALLGARHTDIRCASSAFRLEREGTIATLTTTVMASSHSIHPTGKMGHQSQLPCLMMMGEVATLGIEVRGPPCHRHDISTRFIVSCELKWVARTRRCLGYSSSLLPASAGKRRYGDSQSTARKPCGTWLHCPPVGGNDVSSHRHEWHVAKSLQCGFACFLGVMLCGVCQYYCPTRGLWVINSPY